MGLLVYKFSDYEHTAEREQFRTVCKALCSLYKDKDDICIFIGNYNIYDCELDGIIIKRDAIISVEFKNYGGKVIAVDNGQWKLSDGTIIKGGSRKSVYQQAKLNHVAIKRGFADGNIVDQSCLKDVATLVVFNQDITLDNKLSSKTQSWLHITDNTHFHEKVEDITSKYTDLSNDDILGLIEKLNLDERFLCNEYSNTDLLHNISLCAMSDSENNSVIETTKGTIVVASATLVDTMAEYDELTELKQHISHIIDMLFTTCSVKTNVLSSIEVYNDFKKKGLLLTHMYLVVVEDPLKSIDICKLSKFVHKNITTFDDHVYFWEEGEEIPKEKLTSISNDLIASYKQKIKRKTSTVLPTWLDNYLFSNLRAKYAPEHDRYEYNLNLNKYEVQIYLGTYFPRSYSEVFCIAENLLSNTQVGEIWSKKKIINIFDLGCGTGGEIFGLLIAIDKYISPNVEINIDAMDGNQYSLDALNKILTEYKKRTKRTIDINVFAHKVSSCDSMLPTSENYDFVMCNKMICELISHNIVSKAYYAITQRLASLLSIDGLLLILDVTTKDSRTNYYYPQLMSQQMNGFVFNNADFATLLPLSCANNQNCKKLCFMQQTFSVSHSRKRNDKSKVCYRILGKRLFVESLYENKTCNSRFVIINPQNRENNNYCNLSSGDSVSDAFYL